MGVVCKLLLSRIGTLDITFELTDECILSGNGPLDEVADGDDADEFAIGNDGKVAHAFLCHGL